MVCFDVISRLFFATTYDYVLRGKLVKCFRLVSCLLYFGFRVEDGILVFLSGSVCLDHTTCRNGVMLGWDPL